MKTSQKKGSLLIAAGIALFFILYQASDRMIERMFTGIEEIIAFTIAIAIYAGISLIVIRFGIREFRNDGLNEEKETQHQNEFQTKNEPVMHSISDETENKVLNIPFTGGIIGLFFDSPKNKLAKAIKRENANGMRVVQVIPAESGNVFLIIFRLLILVLTFFLYMPVNGYYVIMEKDKNQR